MVTGTVTRVVTCSSHGNALHYGPTMFVEFENLSNPTVASYMTQFKWDFTSLLINQISKGSSLKSASLNLVEFR